MTKCTEALRLLERWSEWWDYGLGQARPVLDDTRAFLADTPACDAEKAVLVSALEGARMLCMNDHAYDNETSQVFEAVQVINRALADTPPAAAALLVQGERQRKALELIGQSPEAQLAYLHGLGLKAEETRYAYGDNAQEPEAYELEGDYEADARGKWPARIGLIRQVARAALALRESPSGD